MRNGLVVKRLQVDGIDGITVSASIRDRTDSFCLELELENHSQIQQYLKTRDIQLEVIQPASTYLLSYLSPETLARRWMDAANRRANSVEERARFATRTDTKHKPVTETTFNPASINDPTQPVHITTTRIETVTETVPDTFARSEAEREASRIRKEAEAEKRYILSTALDATYIERNSRKRGMIYYDRVPDLKNVLLRIPLGDLTVEIPFKVTNDRFFLRAKSFKFE
jgi:DNA-dependent RNA polymerase auxiliary subunit epsilon